jgi:membrane protease YdiL (CAAX protease family)
VRPPPEDVQRVALQARVLARRPLAGADRAGVLALGAGALLLLLALLRGQRTPATDAGPTTRAAPDVTGGGAAQLIAACLAIAALVLATQVPSSGSALTFAKGLALVSLQGGAALLLARRIRPMTALQALALTAPPARTALWVGGALLAAAALVASAQLSLRIVPRTSEAPIQTFISWPSGMLCFAALGVLLPLGEELFFRGYLYRVALGFGRAAAFWLTFVLFVLLHAQQSWGNWGGLLSIAVTGLALTALRARSESVLIPALAHVLYNFTLSMASF